MAERHFILKIEREESLLIQDTTERYLTLLKKRPDLIERVPQYHLASYLGVTASALNRIIKKIKAGT